MPSWLIVIGLTALLMLGCGAGWRVHGWLRPDPSRSSGAEHLASASLGLVSLLVGFTLAMSLDRYETRRRLVTDEASAILTTFQRDQLLDEPYRTRLDGLLRAYVTERRGLATVDMSPAALDAAEARTEALEQRIWEETVAGLKQPGALALAVPILFTTGQMFDLTIARRAELDAQVPPAVLWIVAAITIIAAAITGYGLAAMGHPHPITSGALFLALALAMTLIFELDEPRTGLIRVPERPMQHVAELILQAPQPQSQRQIRPQPQPPADAGPGRAARFPKG